MRRILLALLLLCGLSPSAALAQDQPRPAAFDRLFAALKNAQDEQSATVIEAHLRALWRQQATPAVRLLIDRGIREMQSDADGDAISEFDAALDLQPDLTEAWYLRALAHRAQGNDPAAIRDIEQVLKREPRHFAAWQALSQIAEDQHNWKGAYAAWQKLLELDPKTSNGQARLQDLRRRALGENT
jgi:tetratricopeptide (TPR) repeat protein